jgi:excisionase family DNA binding protein
MLPLKNVLINLLEETTKKIKTDTCELSEEEALSLVGMLTHIAVSKEEACKYLNISRSRFDDLVREKKLPKGRKRVGFKEVVFYKDELNNCINRIKNGKKKSRGII